MKLWVPGQLVKRRISRLLLCGFVLAALPAYAQAPDWTQYTVGINEAPPGDGASASGTFHHRAVEVTNFYACGQESSFLALTLQDPSKYNGFLHLVIAKLELLEISEADCAGTFNVVFKNGKATDFYSDPVNSPPIVQSREDFAKQMVLKFGQACATSPDPQNPNNLIGPNSFAVSPVPSGAPVGTFTQVTSHVTRDCLTAQINFVLGKVQE